MSFLAPYNSWMRLGSGFNSYTQELCIQDAVLISPPPVAYDPDSTTTAAALAPETNVAGSHSALVPANATQNGATATSSTKKFAIPDIPPRRSTINTMGEYSTRLTSSVPVAEKTPPGRNPNQIVTFSSRLVDNMADVVDALDISASSSIKYGTIKGSGSASYVNENKVNQSDLNYIITVKVTNSEISTTIDRMKFNPTPNLDPASFTEVYGDCFISGFIEGGEFSAIISIKVDSKSKISAVKAAAEAEIAVAAVPGLSVGAKSDLEKKHSAVWKDTETTISVNWSGGGELKPQGQKWDLSTVVAVASRFPNMVETCAQKTSAVLTRYTCLRSFHDENAKLPQGNKFLIRNYELCSLYTQELFNAYMANKQLSTKIADIAKYPERYTEVKKSKHVPNPVEMTAKGLGEARLEARKGMVQITDEAMTLVTRPELADIDKRNNTLRAPPCADPGELARRLPKKRTFPSIRDQIIPNLAGPISVPITAEEIAAVGKWATIDGIDFAALSGDPGATRSPWFNMYKPVIFCTLDIAPDNFTKLRLHGHEHRPGSIFFDYKHYSKKCEGFLSAIGFSTDRDKQVRATEDGTHKHIGNPNDDETFWSILADLQFSTVGKVVVEYFRGTGRIAGLKLLDEGGNEITSWVQYGQAKLDKPPGLISDEHVPPEGRGLWSLCGFWGHVDKIVIKRLGPIWRKM